MLDERSWSAPLIAGPGGPSHPLKPDLGVRERPGGPPPKFKVCPSIHLLLRPPDSSSSPLLRQRRRAGRLRRRRRRRRLGLILLHENGDALDVRLHQHVLGDVAV